MWEIETVGSAYTIRQVYLGYDTGGHPHIVYSHGATNNISIVYGSKLDGEWDFETVVTMNPISGSPSHSMDAAIGNGKIGITWLYRPSPNSNLNPLRLYRAIKNFGDVSFSTDTVYTWTDERDLFGNWKYFYPRGCGCAIGPDGTPYATGFGYMTPGQGGSEWVYCPNWSPEVNRDWITNELWQRSTGPHSLAVGADGAYFASVLTHGNIGRIYRHLNGDGGTELAAFNPGTEYGSAEGVGVNVDGDPAVAYQNADGVSSTMNYLGDDIAIGTEINYGAGIRQTHFGLSVAYPDHNSDYRAHFMYRPLGGVWVDEVISNTYYANGVALAAKANGTPAVLFHDNSTLYLAVRVTGALPQWGMW